MFIKIQDQIINANSIEDIKKLSEGMYWYIILNFRGEDVQKHGPYTKEQADQIIARTADVLGASELTEVFGKS